MTQAQATRWNWKAGILGSLAGGLIFGGLMAMMGMLPMIAGLVGSTSAVVGFLVHMVISFIFGVTFTLFAGLVKVNPILSGALYGVILWFLFPVIMMPLMMGMPPFQFSMGVMMSLVGHVLYGLVTGIVYKVVAK